MEQNLKQYVGKFNPILETKMFSKEECEEIVNKLVEKQDKWENRSPSSNFFMSYGALTYLDKTEYAKKANYFNKMMVKDFDWMYRKIWDYYQMKFHKPVVFQLALPGFHIFQTAEQLNHEYIRNLASIHLDRPHISHDWGEEILAVSSFTIAIDLPKCGAGLNIWENDDIFNGVYTVFFHQMNKKTQLAITKNSEYFPYKLGYIYEQGGMLRHQITCNGDVMEGERRVTVQGHLVETNKEIIIYV